MPQPPGPREPSAADPLASDRGTLPAVRPTVSAGDVVPIGPNLWATVATFAFLVAAPSICLRALEAIWEDAIGEDGVASLFVLANPEEILINAAAGALLLLLIGAILQVWQHQRPFPARWPLLLALPIAWGLIIPEALWRGGTVVSGSIVGAALALAFIIQWGIIVLLDELMD